VLDEQPISPAISGKTSVNFMEIPDGCAAKLNRNYTGARRAAVGYTNGRSCIFWIHHRRCKPTSHPLRISNSVGIPDVVLALSLSALETWPMPRARPKANRFSRRVFIHRLAFFGGGVVLIGPACKRDPPVGDSKAGSDAGANPSANQTFTPEEMAVVSAACDRIIPRDQDPGAVDANVPRYIDRMLQTPEMRKIKAEFVPGVVGLNRQSSRLFGKGFAEATDAERDQVLTLFKESPPASDEARFFDLLMVFTLEGLLGDPSYGGNQDRVGWALVGFGTSEPPPKYDGTKHLHSHGAR
jgi:gluconate 2-dehydrogenase gamma chain